MNSGAYAFGVFIIVYSLATYISIVFADSKRKEANDAIAKIRQLEEEHLAKKAEAIKNKFSEMDKAILEREKAKIYSESEEDEDNISNENSMSTDEQDIDELKKQSGTQFDSNFSTENIQI